MKKYTAALQLFGKNHLASKLAHTCISAFGPLRFPFRKGSLPKWPFRLQINVYSHIYLSELHIEHFSSPNFTGFFVISCKFLRA